MSKVWLITGASRGLGRAFTEEALKAGHRVVAAARNSEQLVEVASKFGESVRTVSLDVTNEAQAKYAVDAAIKTSVASTSSLTMPAMATYAPWKIRRSRTSAHRLKRIYSVSSL